MTKKVLIGLKQAEIIAWMEQQGQAPFRARQLGKWLYEKGARSFDEMTDLSKSLRYLLEQEASVSASQVSQTVTSRDGTTKFLISQQDREIIECVTIVQASHLTACLSSQAGCNVGCPFCATGLSGFRRHLTAGEIIDQFLLMQRQIQQGSLAEFTSHQRIKHIVFMGMGEPLLNYAEVLKSIDILNHEIGIGIRHITISTSGVIPRMHQLMAEPVKYNLAVSLHSSQPQLRDRLVPINRKYKLPELLEASRLYAEKTGRRITFEYTLLKGINDSFADARHLAAALKGIHCHINLIAYNPAGSIYQAPDRASVHAFQQALRQAGFPVNLRQSHGQDKMAACGQLRLQPTQPV